MRNELGSKVAGEALQPHENGRSLNVRISTNRAADQDSEADDKSPSHEEQKKMVSDRTQDGRWTPSEHQLFLDALRLYDKNWKQVQKHVGTRTTTQIRSHAQKYFAKLGKVREEGKEDDDDDESNEAVEPVEALADKMERMEIPASPRKRKNSEHSKKKEKAKDMYSSAPVGSPKRSRPSHRETASPRRRPLPRPPQQPLAQGGSGPVSASFVPRSPALPQGTMQFGVPSCFPPFMPFPQPLHPVAGVPMSLRNTLDDLESESVPDIFEEPFGIPERKPIDPSNEGPDFENFQLCIEKPLDISSPEPLPVRQNNGRDLERAFSADFSDIFH